MRGVEVSPKFFFLFFFDFTQNADRQVLPAVSETENLMRTQRFGALVSKKASHRGSAYSEASEEAEVGAAGSCSGSKEA